MSSLFFGGFVFYEDHLNLNEPEEGQADFSSIQKKTELDSVNEHLKSVSDKMELQRLKALVENMKISNDSSPSSVSSDTNPRVEDQPIVDFSDDPRNRQQAEDFGRTNEMKKLPTDPRSTIYGSVVDERRAEKVKEFERQQQAKAFVANALKDGWKVKLDENYKIKSYERLDRMTEQQENEAKFKGYEILPK